MSQFLIMHFILPYIYSIYFLSLKNSNTLTKEEAYRRVKLGPRASTNRYLFKIFRKIYLACQERNVEIKLLSYT